ncbi:hypothetical protein BCE75_101295 [Isoptericola sp. CG 20/1183]|uniref:Alpha/beta hydrolase family protein n=1 Tax=Isoptericola halotolerans TaxID=300560 RepID=A0ABX5EIZ4_9MICO|nr:MULTISPECIES: hypothetical protein [Isoptericola]PRZ08585.1 hypothetical protein BCL65_102127 [Isoptericola halotolerans]PRZ10968.1 hypothetical protein BCE75_101295 [Isoptericola sp. CG 20/1183]
MVRVRAQVEGRERTVPLLWWGDESRMPAEGVAGVLARQMVPEEAAGALAELLGQVRGEPPSRALTERLLREAADSHVVLGESPETWSPLGSTELPSRGALQPIQDVLHRTGDLWFDAESHDGWLWTRLLDTETTRSGVTIYAPDAFVAVLPPGTTGVTLDLTEDADPDGPFVQEAVEVAMRRGWDGPWVDDGDVAVAWRTYVGTGTAVTDGDATVHPGDARVDVPLSVGGRAGYLVGRLLRRRSGSTFTGSRDPSRSARLARHRRALPHVAAATPELADAGPHDRAVVVVHGTMSCAIPLAETVLDVVGAAGVDVPVLRFEHDTWLPIWESVDELVAGVRALGAASVLLVGHSRGGLVARDAGILLAADGVTVRTLTLGAPFGGTPVIDVTERGRRGLAAGLAALRSTSGPVVDVLTRAVLRELRSQLPEGIRDMHARSSCLGRLRATPGPPFVAAAGSVAPDGVGGDSWGAFPGFFRGLFDGANDRVVAVASATAGRDVTALHVRCDHSSYAGEPAVRAEIAALLAGL